MIANRSVPSATVIPELPYVNVADQQARRSGAKILQPPADHPYGERQYSAEDIGGHMWTFSQSIADIDPALWGGTLR